MVRRLFRPGRGDLAVNRRPVLIRRFPAEENTRDRWCRIQLRHADFGPSAIPYLTLHDKDGQSIAGHLYLRPTGAGQLGVVAFLPRSSVAIHLNAIGGTAGAQPPELTSKPLSRAAAAASLVLGAPRNMLRGFARRALSQPVLLRRSFRQLLLEAAYEARVAREGYPAWIRLFDSWKKADLPASRDQPSIGYLVIAREPESEALAATLRSLEAQWGGAIHRVAGPGASPAEILGGVQVQYIGILAAGEVLPPHATQLAADQLTVLGQPEIAITDEDEIAADGVRHSPLLKPRPNDAYMLSGMLSRGLWLVRRPLLLDAACKATSAEELRLSLWFARHEKDPEPLVRRIPFILTHRRADAETSSPAALAALVGQHLETGGPAIAPMPSWPLTFRLRPGQPGERITAIVPSTLRQPHALRCIQSVLEGTDYPHLDLRVVVMQAAPLDAVQRAAAERLARDPRAQVSWLQAERFNFSVANNHVAARTSGDHILLLNDDISPIRPDWLKWMNAFLHDPRTGLVGARLLYPDGRVQHGGVIMGLSGLCDHAHRYLPGDEPGYMHRAVLAQQLSAVTAACMLVRRSLYQQVGGLDESYPSAYNDVDFALRVGELGSAIVYAPQAELHHYELQTYGSHYAGERQSFHEEEARRMRTRWADVCAADPFHNPNSSLINGFERHLAFPPRVGQEYG